MDEKIKLDISEQDLAQAFTSKTKAKPAGQSPKNKMTKCQITMLISGILGFLAGAVCILYGVIASDISDDSQKMAIAFPKIPSKKTAEETYSKLTGEVLADGVAVDAPTYCIQTPNGTDGARPQAGLNQAGVIFEAIAEAGITRFAAIYQNPSSAVIGPIRSLRIYYLQWDTPFDCTIVHAGGADDAIAAVRAGGYKDLSENYAYMYRGTYGVRLWNNLFTTATYLQQFSDDNGNATSNVKGFARMTPAESARARIDGLANEKLEITTPASGDTSVLNPAVTAIGLRFGGWANFNVNYSYDAESNTYLRSYESGVPHEVYDCPNEDLGERNPEDVCSLTQMAPAVVVALMVDEGKASDNYHEDITTIGSGEAYIFQNGMAVQATWHKDSVSDQIRFTDASGAEIKLSPGQTIVSAVPNYGSVEY